MRFQILMYFVFQHIILKMSFFPYSIWQNKLTKAVLNSTLPLTFIAATIGPVHLAIPVSLIFSITAFVDITTCPSKYPLAIFFVSKIIALVMITYRRPATAPFSFSFFHASFKFSNVTCTILPSVLTFSFRLAVYVLT